MDCRQCVRWLVGWVLGLLVGVAAVQAGEPTGQPLLGLETGMHTAMITRIATDSAGRWAVTASLDKTARIWDVASGEPVGVLRVPQDRGNEGKLYAVAMSPDGAQVAVGGWTGSDWDQQTSIYLFNRVTQRLLRRISGLPNVIHRLAWSPDGRWLAAGLGGDNGVRVFDPTSGQEVGQDSDYGGSAYSVEFSTPVSPGGLRLLSTSLDGQIRLHAVEADGRLTRLKILRSGDGERPYSARFSPDGRWIAIGFVDRPVVQVLRAQDLSEWVRPDVSGVKNGNLSSVAWSNDGLSLTAAGAWAGVWPVIDGRRPMRRWSVGDWTRLADVPLSYNTVTDLVALPKMVGGGWLFAGSDPAWGVVNVQGQMVPKHEGTLADLRHQENQLHLSADGRQLRFGYQAWGMRSYRFDTNSRELALETASAGAVLNAARIEAPGLVVKGWEDNTAPTLNDQPLTLKQDEISRSLAITPDGQRFALGTEWLLRFFDRTGKALWQQPVPSTVWAVNISADARWVVAGYGDGTIRWHRIDDGQEVLAFFPHADQKRWMLWTPEGFFDASSPDAEDLIGYHLNRGKDREGEFIRAAQLRDRFYNPGLVAARLGPDGDRLMAEARDKLGSVDQLLAQARNLPPTVEILSTTPEPGGGTAITYRVTDQGGGIGGETFYLNGQPIDGTRQGGVASGETRKRVFTATGALQISSRSLGGVESRLTPAVNLVGAGPKAPATLHILAVGIAAYRDPQFQRLQHSVADAEQVAQTLARRARPLFERIAPPRVLKDGEATLAGIQQAFDEMKAQMRQDTDTLVIFLAGHGEAPSGRYSFLTVNGRGEKLDHAALLSMLERSPAKTLLLIDSCEAGGMTDLFSGAYEQLGNLKQRAVIGAARLGQFASEGHQGHGVFTAGLLQVLNLNASGTPLTVAELYGQVDTAVTRIVQSKPNQYQQTVDGFIGRAKFPVVQR